MSVTTNFRNYKKVNKNKRLESYFNKTKLCTNSKKLYELLI